MSESLVKLNKFTQGENRVWFDASRGDVDFGYSDGQEIEHRLKAIFSNASDLSCTSYELKSHISDWPTEYHLTPVRSNLIRALDLSGVRRVLELGCGCGSISRYLGDVKQADGSVIQVDSVEGSPIRAELAAMRCRDLENVSVSTANFNQIEFPEDYYDLVLYVGVTEYAGRFSDGKSDTDALQDLLALAKRATTTEGVVMVAIENRTGMKYVQGANEDHYAKPYVGTHNYAQPAGIRTYTKGEWKEHIDLAGFTQQEFIYPFPDYKIPTVFLGENYVDENPFSFNHLEACRSRDYVKIFDFASKEALFWESAAASKTLGDYANSFMILMGNDASAIQAMSHNDFLHLPSYDRNLEFCMSISKPKGQDHIVRQYIQDDAEKRLLISDHIQHQCIEKEPFFQGAMLSVEWSRSLVSYDDLAIFEQYLQDYFDFLQQKQQANQLTIDLLPNNIIVENSEFVINGSGQGNEQGSVQNNEQSNKKSRYKTVDEEWLVSDKLSAEFVYFRAILFFYMTYPDFVEKHIIAHKNLHTLQDLLVYAFSVIDKDVDAQQLLNFADLNERFQNRISSHPVSIDFQAILNKLDNVSAVSWRNDDESFSIQASVSTSGNGKFERETLRFDLPARLRTLNALQFLPCGERVDEKSAFFRVYAVRLLAVNNKREVRELFVLNDEKTIVEQSELIGLEYEQGCAGLGFYVVDAMPGDAMQAHPSLTWEIDELVDGSGEGSVELCSDEFLRCEIETRYPLGEHAQMMLERHSEIFTVQQQLDALKRSRSYALANRLTLLAAQLRAQPSTQLRRVKAIPRRVLSMLAVVPIIGSILRFIIARFKKKVFNKAQSVSWCEQDNQLTADQLTKKPLVSIVIPFRDGAELLEKCVTSITQKSDYSDYEIIGVSNDSVSIQTQKVRDSLCEKYSQLHCPQLHFIDCNIPFNFSALVNQGVAASKGDYVILLNNDIELSSPDWIEKLLGKASLDNVACVGGRLEFPDGNIQHLGLHIGQTHLPEHSFKNMHHSLGGIQPYLQKPRYVTAVTGALLMVSRELWNELGGFDESDFGVAFNDVDFCLRAIELGYQNVVDPNVVAMHHESVSRGYENTVEKLRRFNVEQTTFIARHKSYVEKSDPYFPSQ